MGIVAIVSQQHVKDWMLHMVYPGCLLTSLPVVIFVVLAFHMGEEMWWLKEGVPLTASAPRGEVRNRANRQAHAVATADTYSNLSFTCGSSTDVTAQMVDCIEQKRPSMMATPSQYEMAQHDSAIMLLPSTVTKSLKSTCTEYIAIACAYFSFTVTKYLL